MRLPWIIWVALNIITSICIRERLGDLSHTHTHTGRESSVTTKAEMAVMRPQAKGCTQQPVAGRGNKQTSLRASGKSELCSTVISTSQQ